MRSERLPVNTQISKEVRAYSALHSTNTILCHSWLILLLWQNILKGVLTLMKSVKPFKTDTEMEAAAKDHGSCCQRPDSVSAQCTRYIENNGGRWTEQINLNSFQPPLLLSILLQDAVNTHVPIRGMHWGQIKEPVRFRQVSEQECKSITVSKSLSSAFLFQTMFFFGQPNCFVTFAPVHCFYNSSSS